MNNYQLEKIINDQLKSDSIQDYIPNGLQIEGCKEIKKIILGVSINQKLIDIAIQKQAHAIIVHHGFFWNNECKKILYNQRKRLKSILLNNINVYSWHLPLDIHPVLGNNVQIALNLGINVLGSVSNLVLWGQFLNHITVNELYNTIKSKFYRLPLCFTNNKNMTINNIAWCTGKGQKFIKDISSFDIDTFLTGEASEDTLYYAQENNINFFSIGHYISEKFGIQALGNWIYEKYNIEVEFIDIYNPV